MISLEFKDTVSGNKIDHGISDIKSMRFNNKSLIH